MKVLSFSYCFPNSRTPTWGVFVQQRLTAMADLVDLEVVSPTPTFPLVTRLRGGLPAESNAPGGLRIHRPRYLSLPGILKSIEGRMYARGLRRWLGDFCARRRPDVLDAHFVWPDGVGVGLLARRLGIPYTITLRGWLYEAMGNKHILRQCVEAMQHAAGIISVSGHLAQTAAELGVDRSRIHVIPNGVNTDQFFPRDKDLCRKELGLPTDGRLIVTVAHLGPRKGHLEALEAIARLPEDVRLVLVGGDPEGGKNERRLRGRIGELGLDGRVLLAGPQPYARVPLYLCAADASVLASYREGCPNVVLESLACGTPVVATEVGAVPDLVDPGKNGQVVPPRDAKSLGEGIEAVLEMPWSAQEVSASVAGRSWQSVARDVRDVLASACETAP